MGVASALHAPTKNLSVSACVFALGNLTLRFRFNKFNKFLGIICGASPPRDPTPALLSPPFPPSTSISYPELHFPGPLAAGCELSEDSATGPSSKTSSLEFLT